MKKYYWIAESNDGFDDKSTKLFDTQKEAYEDMRNAVLEKMKWNTEYDEDFENGCTIGYNVKFMRDKIVHESFSGKYTYQIVSKRVYTFDDLEFNKISEWHDIYHAKKMFENGYGISVLLGFGNNINSNGINTYEVAALKKEKDKCIAIMGSSLNQEGIIELMKNLQEL